VTSETDIQWAAVPAGKVLGKMHQAGNKLNIVILNACRDNPFKRSFLTESKGLAQMDVPSGPSSPMPLRLALWLRMVTGKTAFTPNTC